MQLLKLFYESVDTEGCSVFLWDPFLKRLNLVDTTGIEGNPTNDSVYYSIGEGLTGTIARNKTPTLLNELQEKDWIHKWMEITQHPQTSLLAIPIMRPSKPDEILGFIRIVNKLNKISPVVDYFDKDDMNLVMQACRLISLFIENHQNEHVREVVAMQMGHEMLTSAIAIRGSSERLIRKWKSPSFPEDSVKSYLNDILDLSNLQIAQIRTIEYSGKVLVLHLKLISIGLKLVI